MGESDAWIGLTFGIDLDTLESNRISPIDFFIWLMLGPGASRRKVVCPLFIIGRRIFV